jgi:hypothetical protein
VTFAESLAALEALAPAPEIARPTENTSPGALLQA